MSRRAVSFDRLGSRADVDDQSWYAMPNSRFFQYAGVSCQGGIYALAADSAPPDGTSEGGFLCVQQQVTYLEQGHKTLFVRAVSGTNRYVSAGYYNDLDLED